MFHGSGGERHHWGVLRYLSQRGWKGDRALELTDVLVWGLGQMKNLLESHISHVKCRGNNNNIDGLTVCCKDYMAFCRSSAYGILSNTVSLNSVSVLKICLFQILNVHTTHPQDHTTYTDTHIYSFFKSIYIISPAVKFLTIQHKQ